MLVSEPRHHSAFTRSEPIIRWAAIREGREMERVNPCLPMVRSIASILVSSLRLVEL